MNDQEREAAVTRLEASVRRAYQETPAPTPAPDWDARVMQAVRAAGQPGAAMAEVLQFVPQVWRFAAAAAVLVVALGLLGWRTGLSPEADLARFYLADPVGLLCYAPLGL